MCAYPSLPLDIRTHTAWSSQQPADPTSAAYHDIPYMVRSLFSKSRVRGDLRARGVPAHAGTPQQTHGTRTARTAHIQARLLHGPIRNTSTYPLHKFLEILFEISMSVQIHLSRNFRGNKHVPADGVAGNVRATSPTSPCLPFRARRELAGSPQARKFRPKTARFCQNL